MKPGAMAQLRLVPAGTRKSLEDVLRETWQSPRWAPHFLGFRQPYLHLSPEQYKVLAEQAGLKVLREHVTDKSWDFGSRKAFSKFAEVTFVEWTHMLQAADDKDAFTNDVLDRYAQVAGDESTFRFYQMDIRLGRS